MARRHPDSWTLLRLPERELAEILLEVSISVGSNIALSFPVDRHSGYVFRPIDAGVGS